MPRILGQTRAIETLAASLRTGRVHHAWIFAGPKGVGKFTTAAEFGSILLDPNMSPDGKSSDFRSNPDSQTAQLIAAGTHPDFFVIRKELALHSDNPALRQRKLMNIPIDLLRERMLGGRTGDDRVHEASAYRTAALGRGKMFIIDEAELLDAVAQNALLKTLEEPPERTYIVLVSSQPQRLLPTIRSRCQFVQFNPLDDASLRAWFDASGLDVSGEERIWIENFCQGSPGMAQLAAEYELSQWHRTLAPMLTELQRGVFPVEMGATMAELVEDFAKRWVDAHDNASKDAANKDGVRLVLTMLATHARTRLNQAVGDDRGDRGDRDESAADRWLSAIDLIRTAEREMQSNVNVKFLLENLVVQWADGGTRATAAVGLV